VANPGRRLSQDAEKHLKSAFICVYRRPISLFQQPVSGGSRVRPRMLRWGGNPGRSGSSEEIMVA